MVVNNSCLICNVEADSVHFGAMSCRACAAFFRRIIAGKRILKSRCDQECVVNKNYRKLCPYCRYKKCLKFGMKASAVERRMQLASTSSQTTNNPILSKLQQEYENMENKRRIVFGTDKNSHPQTCNYNLLNEIGPKNIEIITESLLKTFLKMTNVPEDQEKILTRHFLPSFMILESCILTKCSNLGIIPDRYYVDLKHVDKFYISSLDNLNEMGTKAYLIFEQYWKKLENISLAHINDIKLDRQETVFLFALLFWDFGLLDQSDDCIKICLKFRSKVIEELAEYEKKKCTNEDHCIRIANIMMTLHCLHRNLHYIHESKEVSKIYNVYDTHRVFYEQCSD